MCCGRCCLWRYMNTRCSRTSWIGIGNMAHSCTHCGSPNHTKFYCPSRPRKPIKRSPLNKRGRNYYRWQDVRKYWIKRHKTHAGSWICHYCGCLLEEATLTLDHLRPRSLAPELRYEPNNLVPCCGDCNRLKGSCPHDSYVHSCHTPLPR